MKFVIAILHLVLLFVGSIFQTASQVTKPQLPTVVQCDLLNNAALYDGKEIRLTGFYLVAGTEVSKFGSSSCGNAVVWVEFNADYQSCSNSRAVQSLIEMRNNSGFRWSRPHGSVVSAEFRSADVEFVGRFSAHNRYKPPSSSENVGPLGPVLTSRQRADFVFSVSCLNRVKPLPKSAH